MSCSFDFKEYLSSICPEDEFEICVLTGGLVNHTVRATRQTSTVGNTSPPAIRDKSSFIIKYAPGYIATIGETAPFSQYRQTIESRALDLITNTPPFSSLSRTHPHIHVPLLFRHDVGKHVLIIEDLGSLETIDKWFEGHREVSDSTIAAVGTDLGKFLADLHLSTTSQNREYLAAQFENHDVQHVIHAQVVQPVLGILEEYAVPNANQVYEIIEKEFQVGERPPQKILNLGDLWPGSILVSQDGTEIGVIDWEFAGMAHPSQDIGQFAGHLQCKILMNQDFSDTYRLFSIALFASYGARLREGNAPWLLPDLIDDYVRGLFVVHGRELINSTTFAQSCGCLEPRCQHRRAAVQKGVDYVLRAIDFKIDFTNDDFLQPIFQLSDSAPDTFSI